MWGCLGSVAAALVTGCFALMVALDLPSLIRGWFPGTLPATPTVAAPTFTPVPTPVPTNTLAPSSAQFQQVWVDFNVTENNFKGMIIHLEFTIFGYKDVPCTAVAYIHYNSGAPLRDANGAYRDALGNVAAWNYFTPGFESTSYDDLTIFIPYDEFHLESGSYDLKYAVILYVEDTQAQLTDSGFYGFSFDK